METTQSFIVPEITQPLRLDLFLYDQMEGISRSQIQNLIKNGKTTVNQKTITKPAYLINSGDHVTISQPEEETSELIPENIPLDILYEDKHIIVINKPAGMVVHPATGHTHGTLVNAILHHCKDFIISGDPLRPGIVHRLDINTSGVLVIAKNPEAYFHLRQQVENREFSRKYIALVKGIPKSKKGTIDASIGRSLADPKRMSVTGVSARDAITHFQLLKDYSVLSLLELKLNTGRTHQIRVHLRFIGHPVIGDPVYGFTDYASLKLSPSIVNALQKLPGQALHAQTLGFTHPITHTFLECSAPLPDYFQNILDELNKHYVKM